MEADIVRRLALGTLRANCASFVVLIACLLGATSCDTKLATTADAVDRIVLTPNSGSVQVGATLTLSAAVLDASGNSMRDRRVVWTSERETIATVSQAGVVIALAAGEVRIAASSGGKSASAVITVTARPVSLVRITPGSATISVSSSIPLHAEALDASGAVVTGRPVAWTSSNETVAIVSANGVVAGLSAGSVTITATIDGRAGTAAIAVAPQAVASVSVTPAVDTTIVGGRTTFLATALDAQNQPLADRFVLWSSNNPTVATVSSEGEVIGLALGSARIRAVVEGKFADATVVVDPVPVARVVVAPGQVTLNPAQTSQLTVTLRDSSGNVLLGRTISYSTSDEQVATVSAAGLIIAIAEGAATVQVSSEGASASVAVTVNPTPVASISVTPNAVSMLLSQTRHLVAQALDAQGNPLANRTYTWSSSDASVATVSQSGDVTSVGAGSATITAASGGQAGSAAVSVGNVPVAQIVISPNSVALIPAQIQQLTAQLFDSIGGSLSPAGRTITWLSRDPTIASVSGTGQVGGVAAGVTWVLASTSGATAPVVDSVSVTVSSRPISSTTVQPRASTVIQGGTAALRAVVVSAGTIVRTSKVSWQSRAAAIVSVTPDASFPDSATVTGISLGSAYVVATDAAGLSDSSLITVTAAPVASLAVTPPIASLAVNATTQLTAVATDAAGGTVSPPITWASLAPSVATVSTSGLVTALSGGTATIEARAAGAGVNGVDVVGSAAVNVTVTAQAAVHTVTVTSPRTYLVPGDTMHVAVVLRDAQNNVLTGRPITFSSNGGAQMTVDANGVVTGGSTSGHSDIVATSEGKNGKVKIDGADPVFAMTVSGPTNSALDLIILPGGKKRYTVIVEDAKGKGLGGQTIVITTNNPSLLSFSKTSVTTSGSGKATVDISAGTSLGVATVTFTAPRAGAIPPASAGSNSPAATLLIVVP